ARAAARSARLRPRLAGRPAAAKARRREPHGRRAMTGSLQGRVAVVTGGGSGIGAACVRILAARGARVVVADMHADAAPRLAAEVGGTAMTVDVRDAEAVQALADHTEAEVGPAAILVTSAGIVQPPLPPEELPLELYDNVYAVNQRGTYLTARAFA